MKAKADLISKKGKRNMEVKERLAEARHRAMAKYKASTNITAKKARAVATFQTSKEFYTYSIAFSEEAFQEDHKLDQNDYHLLVATQYPELDLSQLDEQDKLEEEPPSMHEDIAAPVFMPRPSIEVTTGPSETFPSFVDTQGKVKN